MEKVTHEADRTVKMDGSPKEISQFVDFEEIKQMRSAQMASQSDFEDKNFPFDMGDLKIKWKSLKNFEEKVELFEDGRVVHGRMVPGKLGNPNFAVTLSCIANHPKLLKYIFPEGQEINNPDIGGFFHFRFWKMGRWVYVYTDDKLPFIEEKKVGKSKSAKKDGKRHANDNAEACSSTTTCETNDSKEKKSLSSADNSSTKECKKDEPRKSCVKSTGNSEEAERISDNIPATNDELKAPTSCQGVKTSKVGLEGSIHTEKSDKSPVDDKLKQMPFTYVAGENERMFYWASLLEKAYAKFCGGYRHLTDKSLDDILLDLTGGIIEDWLTSSANRNSFLDLKSHCDKHALIVAVSDNLFHNNAQSQDILQEELPDQCQTVIGSTLEADSCIVTKIQFVDLRKVNGLDEMVGFVRLLDPFGSFKWEDTWIGAIEEWKLIPEQARQRLRMETRSAFECYLSYSNFLKAFPKLKVCTVPDGRNFNCEGYSGQWTIPRRIKGMSDFGKLHLHKSPQHRIYVRDVNEPDEPDLEVEIVASLILNESTISKAPIGFWLLVYELHRPGMLPFDFDYFRFRNPVAISDLSSAARLKLQQGHYLAVLAVTSVVDHPTKLKYLLRFAIPAKFDGKLSQTDQLTFEPYADSIDVTNYLESPELLEEERSSTSGEKTAKLRRRSEKASRKEKPKGKKKKMKR